MEQTRYPVLAAHTCMHCWIDLDIDEGVVVERGRQKQSGSVDARRAPCKRVHTLS